MCSFKKRMHLNKFQEWGNCMTVSLLDQYNSGVFEEKGFQHVWRCSSNPHNLELLKWPSSTLCCKNHIPLTSQSNSVCKSPRRPLAQGLVGIPRWRMGQHLPFHSTGSAAQPRSEGSPRDAAHESCCSSRRRGTDWSCSSTTWEDTNASALGAQAKMGSHQGQEQLCQAEWGMRS